MSATTYQDPTELRESGRDARGRFVRGNKGGPGNPFARQVAQLRKVLLQCLTEEEMTAICRALIKRAKEGDVPAARLLFQYALGRPPEAADPDRLDIDELEMHRGGAELFEDVLRSAHVPDTSTLLGLMDTMRPEMGREYAERLEEKKDLRAEQQRINGEKVDDWLRRSPFYVSKEELWQPPPPPSLDAPKGPGNGAQPPSTNGAAAQGAGSQRPSANGAKAIRNGTRGPSANGKHRPSTNGSATRGDRKRRPQTAKNGKRHPAPGRRRFSI